MGKNNRTGKRLRLIPLILGAYGAFLGFGLTVMGFAEIREGIGIARLLVGLVMAGFGLLGIWDGVRDLVIPDKKQEQAPVSQFILTDISGTRSSNVTVERLREQLKSLAENDSAAVFKLEILPPLAVQEMGKLCQIFCMYHNTLILTAFINIAEGKYETCHIRAEQSAVEEWFEKLLNGRPDLSGWEKAE